MTAPLDLQDILDSVRQRADVTHTRMSEDARNQLIDQLGARRFLGPAPTGVHAHNPGFGGVPKVKGAPSELRSRTNALIRGTMELTGGPMLARGLSAIAPNSPIARANAKSQAALDAALPVNQLDKQGEALPGLLLPMLGGGEAAAARPLASLAEREAALRASLGVTDAMDFPTYVRRGIDLNSLAADIGARNARAADVRNAVFNQGGGLAGDIFEGTNKQGGGTWGITGKPYSGSGYAVADPAFTRTDISTPAQLADWLKQPEVRSRLKQPYAQIGSWKNPENGQIEFNITSVYPEKADALRAGVAGRQLALGHFVNGEYVGDIPLASKGNDFLRHVAQQYQATSGITHEPLGPVTKEEVPAAGRRMAQVYEGLQSNPNDPAVRAAYAQFAKETEAQGQALRAAGITPDFTQTDPYPNSAAMMADVRNGTIKVFKTPEGAHPLLTPAQNDEFRFVHDVLGHAMEGNQFGPWGEEQAARLHSRLYSPLARQAMLTETRGQNSWLNFAPGHEDLPLPERPFPEQKAALWPAEYSGEYRDFPEELPPPGPAQNVTEPVPGQGGPAQAVPPGQAPAFNTQSALDAILPHLTADQAAGVTSGRAALRDRLVDVHRALSSNTPIEALQAAMRGGITARGGYNASARALSATFGKDAPRFTALLAALSPQQSVQRNIELALNVWNDWKAAGGGNINMKDLADILIRHQSATGEGENAMQAWLQNGFRALNAPEEAFAPGNRLISGPKVNNFMHNLQGDVNRITLDTHQAQMEGIGSWGKRTAVRPADASHIVLPGKQFLIESPEYLAGSARVTEAARGLGLLPTEGQETGWSWLTALLNEAGGAKAISQGKVPEGTLEALARRGVGQGDIARQTWPGLDVMLQQEPYAGILQRGGYTAPPLSFRTPLPDLGAPDPDALALIARNAENHARGIKLLGTGLLGLGLARGGSALAGQQAQ